MTAKGLSPEMIRDARRRLLRLHFESRTGHLGGNLSCLDILLCLHHEVMTADDVFILSKGHSAGALYVTLWSTGRLAEEDLRNYHTDGTRLGVHPPPHGIPGIVFATGSLGHGLGLAAGMALAKKLRSEPGRVFCLTSDGEWNEGSCWESLIFAVQHGLDNLTFIVDVNGMQGFGPTCEIADLAPLAEKFQAFRVSTHELDGHDHSALTARLRGPQVGVRGVLAKTHKGNGVSFMQDRWQCHYLPLDEHQYRKALEEVDRTCEESSLTRS